MSGGKQMFDKKIEAIRDLARIIYAEEQTLRAQSTGEGGEVKLNEATPLACRIRRDPNLQARVVRILPESIDPVNQEDNGFDVLVTVLDAEVK